MDAKKRVAVPSGWLSKKEGEEFYVVPHPSERFLMVMPSAELQRWESIFDQSSGLTPAQRREAVRMFFASAHRVATDSQGRILLREDHCEATGLKGPLVAVGSKSRFEFWDKGRYEESVARAKEIYLKVAEDIGL